MTRLFSLPLSAVAALICLVPLVMQPQATMAQDDFRSVLQDQSLELSIDDLIDNDGADLESLPTITIEAPPTHGSLIPSDAAWVYTPSSRFFGVDAFDYAWISDKGERIEARVELLVVPWIVPLAGEMGLIDGAGGSLGESEGIGYYNSHSGIFYLCAENLHFECSALRYPEVEPGWLPVLGSWRDHNGQVYSGRPGLYDPEDRRLLLLDEVSSEDRPASCQGCGAAGATRQLHVIASIDVSAVSATSVPIAADLDGDGIDTVLFFDLERRRFAPSGWIASTTLDDAQLWPLAMADTAGRDAVAVYGRQSGHIEKLGAEPQIEHAWVGVSSLPTARRLGSRAIREVYDVRFHGLSEFPPVWVSDDDGRCVPSGTQTVRFPSDPDPPPSGGGGEIYDAQECPPR